MAATFYFGFLLIALSAFLLAQHWRQAREFPRAADAKLPNDPTDADRGFLRLQLQRRAVASGLIGLVGAAIAVADRVPRTPQAVTSYLFGLLIAGSVIFAIAVFDLRAARRRRELEALDLLARKLREAKVPATKRTEE